MILICYDISSEWGKVRVRNMFTIFMAIKVGVLTNHLEYTECKLRR